MPPLDLMLEFGALGVMLPGVVVVVGLWLASRVARRSRAAGSFLATLAIVAGFSAAYFGLAIGALRPAAAHEWRWLPHTLAAAGLLIWLTHLSSLSLVRVLGVMVAAALAADRLIPYWESLGPLRNHWDIGLASAIISHYFLFRDTAERGSPGSLALGLTLSFLAVAIILLADSAVFAQLAVILMACAAGVSVAAWWNRASPVLATALALLAFPLCGLLVSGYLGAYSGIPRWCYLLVWVAPFCFRVPATFDQPSSKTQMVLQWVGFLLALGIAVGQAIRVASPFDVAG